jgi:O-glycosyl hydrolase
MCKSRCSSGGKNPTQNNLRDDCYDEFAKYLADVTEYINNSLKIKVSSISPMNEPDTDFWHYLSEKQEGCHFDPGESQNKIILKTAREIRSRGLNHIDIVASDETSTDKAINSYNLYNDDVKKVVDRISTHTYGSDKIKELGDLMKAEQKNLWMSETDWSSVSGEDTGEMGAGLWFAQKIIYDINNLSPSAWVIWLTIDHHISRDGFMGNKDTGAPDINNGYWGIAFADHDNEEILLTKKYYCYGQFSRYIRPGDTILHTTNKSLGAYNKKDNKLTLVAVNDKNRKKQITIDITDFKNNGIIEVIRTSGDMNSGENWAKVDEIVFNSPIITLELKANSVTTFIIK